MSYGSETDALALFAALTADDTVTIPPVDLSSFKMPGEDWLLPITKLTNADITTKEITGTGTFDVFMSGLAVQLRQEYDKNRITGAEYTKAYVAMAQSAMQFSVQFLLGRDQAFWAAIQAQISAVTAQVALETAKLQYAALQLEVLTGKANYALAKIRLATEDVNFGAAKYNLENMLPQQLATGAYNLNFMLPQQYAAAKFNVDQLLPMEFQTKQYNLNYLMAEQYRAAKFQTDFILPDQLAVSQYNLNYLLPLQLNTGKYNLSNIMLEQYRSAKFNVDFMMPEQLELSKQQIQQSIAQTAQIKEQTILTQKQEASIMEQTESARAQTLDTRTDGTTPVVGVLGKQKDLYTQQIASYKRDSENKTAKIFTDSWITMLTINESTPVPGAFTNANLDIMLSTLAKNNGFPDLVAAANISGADPKGSDPLNPFTGA